MKINNCNSIHKAKLHFVYTFKLFKTSKTMIKITNKKMDPHSIVEKNKILHHFIFHFYNNYIFNKIDLLKKSLHKLYKCGLVLTRTNRNMNFSIIRCHPKVANLETKK